MREYKKMMSFLKKIALGGGKIVKCHSLFV